MIKLINFIDLTLEEKKLVLKWRNNPIIKRWMFDKKEINLTTHLNYIESLVNHKNKIYFVVKQGDRYIGVIDFTNINYIDLFATIGIYSNPDLNKMGDILLKKIISYGFDTIKLKTLYCEVYESNTKAIKLYERFDFRYIYKKDNIIKMELNYDNR